MEKNRALYSIAKGLVYAEVDSSNVIFDAEQSPAWWRRPGDKPEIGRPLSQDFFAEIIKSLPKDRVVLGIGYRRHSESNELICQPFITAKAWERFFRKIHVPFFAAVPINVDIPLLNIKLVREM
jgi:hypothetical protein